MPDPPFTFGVTGIENLSAALRALEGREQARAVSASMARTMRRVVVPELKAEARSQTKRVGSHRDRKGVTTKPGRGGPMSAKITVRNVRKRRSSETVAISAASRAWYDHFFTRGTRPHVIAARTGPGGTAATGRQVRAINRLAREEYSTGSRSRGGQARALFFGGVFREQVQHPGSPAHDWVGPVARRAGPRLERELVNDLTTHVAAASRRAARRR